MKIDKININDQQVISFLAKVDESLFYHTPAYLALLSEHLKADAFYLVIKSNGSINSLMPVMVKKSEIGIVYNSLAYYGSNGSILQRDECYEEFVNLITSSTVIFCLFFVKLCILLSSFLRFCLS